MVRRERYGDIAVGDGGDGQDGLLELFLVGYVVLHRLLTGRESGLAGVRSEAGSDEALVALVAMGDQDALTALVRRLQGQVFGLARRVLDGDGARAEEVAQEAFLRLWRHAGSFDVRRGSVRAWVLTITRNLAIDARRLRRDEPVDPSWMPELDPLLAGRPVEELALGVGDRERVRRALFALSPEQRRAIVLVAWGGRTAQEVAEQEGIPLGTAKTRIRSAMSRLRLGLGPAPEGGSGPPSASEGEAGDRKSVV